MNVHTDRTVSVREEIRVSFSGYDSHGIIRDFATDGGVTYSDITAECDHADFSPYFETEDGFLSFYLRGDGVVTGQERTYTLHYTLTVPALAEEGYLPLDVIGYGWQTALNNVSALITLKSGGMSSRNTISGRERSVSVVVAMERCGMMT